MKTYGARVRVPAPNGVGTMVTLAQVQAANPAAARGLLESLYGRGNLVSVPVLMT